MWYICIYTYTTVKKFKKKWWALCVSLNHSISRTLISKRSGLIGQIRLFTCKKKKVKLGLIKEKVWKIFSTHKIFGQTFRCVQAFHCERYLAMQIKFSNFKSVLFVVTQSGSPLACCWISLGAWQTSGLAGGYLCQDFLFHANKFQNDPQRAADGFEVRFWLHKQISGWNWKTALKILTVDDSILFIHTELRTELLNINAESPHMCTVCATDSSAVLFKVFLLNELFCKDFFKHIFCSTCSSENDSYTKHLNTTCIV